MRRPGKFALIVAATLCVLALLFYFLLSSSSQPTVTLPSPNAYDTYVEAGNSITQTPGFKDADTEEVRTFVSTHADTLALIQQAADQELVVPIDYEAHVADPNLLWDDMPQIRNSMWLLYADGLVAERDGQLEEAGDKYIKMIEMCRRSANEGMLIHLELARGMELVGLRKVQGLVSQLTPEQQHTLAKKLSATRRDPYPFAEFMERETYLSRQQHGWVIQLTAMNRMRRAETKRLEAEDATTLAIYDDLIGNATPSK